MSYAGVERLRPGGVKEQPVQQVSKKIVVLVVLCLIFFLTVTAKPIKRQMDKWDTILKANNEIAKAREAENPSPKVNMLPQAAHFYLFRMRR